MLSVADEERPAQDAGQGRKIMTLGERGPVLPLGIADPSGALHRDLEFRRWTGAVMRDLGKKRGEGRELSMSEHVGLVLSVLATRIGPHDFTTLSRKEQKLVISQMHMGDVFYAYCYARVQALGPQIVLDMACPVCRTEFKFEGDLNQLTLSVAEKIEDARWEYELRDPVEIRGAMVTRLAMGPALWHHVETAQVVNGADIEGGKLAMVAGSIRGAVGREQFPLTSREIDEFSGSDIEGIVGELDEHHIGPDMRVETACPNRICRTKLNQPINWAYHYFFGPSSRSRSSGKSTTGSSPLPSSHAAE